MQGLTAEKAKCIYKRLNSDSLTALTKELKKQCENLQAITPADISKCAKTYAEGPPESIEAGTIEVFPTLDSDVVAHTASDCSSSSSEETPTDVAQDSVELDDLTSTVVVSSSSNNKDDKDTKVIVIVFVFVFTILGFLGCFYMYHKKSKAMEEMAMFDEFGDPYAYEDDFYPFGGGGGAGGGGMYPRRLPVPGAYRVVPPPATARQVHSGSYGKRGKGGKKGGLGKIWPRPRVVPRWVTWRHREVKVLVAGEGRKRVTNGVGDLLLLISFIQHHPNGWPNVPLPFSYTSGKGKGVAMAQQMAITGGKGIRGGIMQQNMALGGGIMQKGRTKGGKIMGAGGKMVGGAMHQAIY
eukprot:g6330.t1